MNRSTRLAWSWDWQAMGVMATALLIGCAKTSSPSPPVKGPTNSVKAPTPEELAKKILDGMDHMAAEVAALNTTESATAAAPRLEKDADELKREVEQFKALLPLSPDQFVRRRAEFAARVKETMVAYFRQLDRMHGDFQIDQPLEKLHTQMDRVPFLLTFTFIERSREPPVVVGAPVTIIIQGLPSGVLGRLLNVLRPFNDYGSYSAEVKNDKATIVLENIGDLTKLADGITFGKVASVDEAKRTIVVEFDPSKIP
jgi:hypothetical protein